jgi:hypothetical protein
VLVEVAHGNKIERFRSMGDYWTRMGDYWYKEIQDAEHPAERSCGCR